MPRRPDDLPPPFEIALAMAGACSAGAYTAGVIDFLLEALDAWETEKAGGAPDIPDHRVLIRAAAGTSAGGVVAALLAMLPFTGHRPIRDLAAAGRACDPADAAHNLLYRSWVSDIDLAALMDTGDLAPAAGRVASLLNGDVLGRIADAAIVDVRAAIARPPAAPPPGYIANPLQLFLCFTNIHGMPFIIPMISSCDVRGHRVTNHAYCAHFAVFGTGSGEGEPLPAGPIGINAPETVGFDDLDGWGRLRDAALATSAFPGGLPARPFEHKQATFDDRCWSDPGGFNIPGDATGVAPLLPLIDGQRFWCVDGGLINNEPVQYAKAALSHSRPDGGGDDPQTADHAVILIDPFPDHEAPLPAPSPSAPDLIGALLALLPIMRAHVHFKPEQLLEALDENIHSRFLISPSRPGKRPGETDLASQGLGGFSGFVHEQLRMHDFQLGRHNCQRFLRDHFCVHVENPLVRAWVPRLRAAGRLAPYQPQRGGQDGRSREDYVQVIPLLPHLREPLALRPWPALDRRRVLPPLEAAITARSKAMVPGLVRAALGRLQITEQRVIGRIIRAIASGVITDKVGNAVLNAIAADLEKRGLLAAERR
jgi:hypothetical protein